MDNLSINNINNVWKLTNTTQHSFLGLGGGGGLTHLSEESFFVAPHLLDAPHQRLVALDVALDSVSLFDGLVLALDGLGGALLLLGQRLLEVSHMLSHRHNLIS
jgi:hypothetical protein